MAKRAFFPVLLAALGLAAPLGAQEPSGEQHPPLAEAAPAPTPADELDTLFASLADADPSDAKRIESRIMALWAKSGSASMDYLLTRGREALEDEEAEKAVEHLSALVGLAPDFAEGWNARATAHFVAKDYWAAMLDIQRTLELEPRHFGALVGLGTILEQTGDEAGALAAHRAALAVYPELEPSKEALKRLAPSVDGRDL